MTAGPVGVRTTRGGPIEFVMSSDPELNLGDVVIVESPPARYLAFVALTADHILAGPERICPGSIVAGPRSREVAAALHERDLAARECAQLVFGSTTHIAGARWSADGGRLTLDVVAEERECAALTVKLEPVLRTEVVCRPAPGNSTSA